MENNELYVFIVGGRTFGGRALEEGGIEKIEDARGADKEERAIEIIDCVEFIPAMNNQGSLSIIGVLMGDIEDIPEDCLIIKVSKKSLYYQSYVKTTSGIEIGGRGIA